MFALEGSHTKRFTALLGHRRALDDKGDDRWGRLALNPFLVFFRSPRDVHGVARTLVLTKHFRGKWEVTIGVCCYLTEHVSDCILAKIK